MCRIPAKRDSPPVIFKMYWHPIGHRVIFNSCVTGIHWLAERKGSASSLVALLTLSIRSSLLKLGSRFPNQEVPS